MAISVYLINRIILLLNSARILTRNYPYLGDAEIWLGRALLTENKITDSATHFQNALKDPLPTPFVLAWANLGLGDIAVKTGRTAEALKYFSEAVGADAEYGATLAGRLGMQKLGSVPVDESVKAFFTQLDKAITTARKTEVDSFIVPGEIQVFFSVVGGQPERWITTVVKPNRLIQIICLPKLFYRSNVWGARILRMEMRFSY